MKWSTIAQKPRYSEEMESGVLYFVALAKAQSEKWGVRGGKWDNKINYVPHSPVPHTGDLRMWQKTDDLKARLVKRLSCY